VRWLGAATSDKRSVSGSQAPMQTACLGTLFSLTTILKHTVVKPLFRYTASNDVITITVESLVV